MLGPLTVCHGKFKQKAASSSKKRAEFGAFMPQFHRKRLAMEPGPSLFIWQQGCEPQLVHGQLLSRCFRGPRPR